jgi:hypothetical protein
LEPKLRITRKLTCERAAASEQHPRHLPECVEIRWTLIYVVVDP